MGPNARGLKQVLGALECSHIPITYPRGTVDECINRQRYFSAEKRHRRRFTDVYKGWPGRIRNARMLRESQNRQMDKVAVQYRTCVMLSLHLSLAGLLPSTLELEWTVEPTADHFCLLV
jgi:hypothetical protein